MERNILAETVRRTLIEVLGHDRFEMRDDLTAPDVEGWDSLTHMSIITALEKAFSIRFKLREINHLRNLGTLMDLIATKVA
ncbi:MAG: acyl carrier protein [Flavobacteriales bacterium]|nr:acyl carrier protein [Flavobacteriales bacterium]